MSTRSAVTQNQPIPLLSSDYSAVPQELKQQPNWVVWQAPSKIPYNPAHPDVGAKANDSSTWGTYRGAVTVAALEGFTGIGFEFGGTDFVGVDFDDVLDNGDPDPFVLEVLKLLGDPYCEKSPSSTGLHAFVQCAKLPKGLRKFSDGNHHGIEIYSGSEGGRYFTVTGEKFSGEGVPKIDDIALPYFLISKFADNKFKKLWLGDASDFGNDHSKADCALLGILARCFSKDPKQIDHAFSASKLGQRDKWIDRPDYRERSIEFVLSGKSPEQFAQAEVSEPEANQPSDSEPAQLISRTGNTIAPKRIKWLWDYKIPLGKITLFAGNPDNGKSLAVTSVAAICSTGKPFPDCPNTATTIASDVLMLLGEDDLDDTAVPRLMAADADMAKIHFVEAIKDGATAEEREIRLDQDIQIIEARLEENKNIRLIVIDPISNYLGGINMVAEQDVRRVLIPLKRMAELRNIAIVLVMHLNKKQDLAAITRVGGAMAFIGVARSSWLFQRDEPAEDGTVSESFSMSRIKNNLAAASYGGLAFAVKVNQLT